MDPNVLSATKCNTTRQASRHMLGKFTRHLMPGGQQHAPNANKLLAPSVQDPSTTPAIMDQHPNEGVTAPRKQHPPRDHLLHQLILARQHLQPFSPQHPRSTPLFVKLSAAPLNRPVSPSHVPTEDHSNHLPKNSLQITSTILQPVQSHQ